jgi:hypothetical protein
MGFRSLAETLDEPMQTITNAERLKIIERREIGLPRNGIPSKHYHHRPDEEENGGKQNGINYDIGCGVLHLNIRHGVTSLVGTFVPLMILIYHMKMKLST